MALIPTCALALSMKHLIGTAQEDARSPTTVVLTEIYALDTEAYAIVVRALAACTAQAFIARVPDQKIRSIVWRIHSPV